MVLRIDVKPPEQTSKALPLNQDRRISALGMFRLFFRKDFPIGKNHQANNEAEKKDHHDPTG